MRSKALDKIIAILAGIAIWAYVISVLDPIATNTIRAVPVQLVNVESMESAGLAIAGSGEYTVDVVVGGSRSDVKAVATTDLIATADLSGLHIGQNYITVSVTAPDNITVNEVRTQNIQVYVDSAVSSEKDLKIFTANLPEQQELGAIEAGTKTIVVSGAQSLVEKVTSVQATIDAAALNTDEVSTQSINVVPIDAEGNKVIGVKLSQEQVNIKAVLYNLKEVALNVPVEGELNDHVSLLSEIVPSSVVIKGPSLLLADIWQIQTSPIDKTQITETCSIPLEFALPEGIELAHNSRNLTADYEIKGRSEKHLTFTAGDIVFVNATDDMNINMPEGLELTFSVYTDEANAFDESSVDIYVDLANLAEGSHEVGIASIEIPEFEDVIIENDLKQVKLKIKLSKN